MGPEAQADDGADVPRYAPDEIIDAVGHLSPAELARIEDISRYFAPRCAMQPEDLRQEAYARAFGTRSCKVGTGMVDFLAGIMKSIASDGYRSRKKAREDGALEVVYVEAFGANGVPEPAFEAPSPEEAALSRRYHGDALAKALACIDGDEELQLLAEGVFDGLRGKELEDLLDKDTKGLAAVRKRLARRLAASFPNGVSV
ncbi:hypothetical protein PMNALOAF_2247 [Methylobacterium adhaesivum]|uniref:Sigma-70 family RNA polymerase sigma factor n=1 Tax=Methylobacterium adhaesivum TaxID=333297 RepID=A0ABT8BLG5_9HYPH|nr:hypothetical protein [Methylobacterium adhaesivum]MDN3593052.1 hypothetical protein [Methylobacterium adhaesivum]GJD30995.1 hypothetical protein PMNALOAF_2247 [Methylobacterium adhaesivum]